MDGGGGMSGGGMGMPGGGIHPGGGMGIEPLGRRGGGGTDGGKGGMGKEGTGGRVVTNRGGVGSICRVGPVKGEIDKVLGSEEVSLTPDCLIFE